MFNKLQAQRWWGENYDRIMELYNVQRFNKQALNTPPRSEDEVKSFLFHHFRHLLGYLLINAPDNLVIKFSVHSFME